VLSHQDELVFFSRKGCTTDEGAMGCALVNWKLGWVPNDSNFNTWNKIFRGFAVDHFPTSLPRTIRIFLERRDVAGGGMNVGDSDGSFLRSREQIAALRCPVFLFGNWNCGDLAQVT